MRNSTGEFPMRYGGSFTVMCIILQNGFPRNVRCPSIVLHRDSDDEMENNAIRSQGTFRGTRDTLFTKPEYYLFIRSLYPSQLLEPATASVNYFGMKVASHRQRERVRGREREHRLTSSNEFEIPYATTAVPPR